jgi:hypothetical protein
MYGGIHGSKKPRTAMIQAFHKPSSNSGTRDMVFASSPLYSLFELMKETATEFPEEKPVN